MRFTISCAFGGLVMVRSSSASFVTSSSHIEVRFGEVPLLEVPNHPVHAAHAHRAVHRFLIRVAPLFVLFEGVVRFLFESFVSSMWRSASSIGHGWPKSHPIISSRFLDTLRY